ncbi:MAG: HAD-IA family hydrolase [Hydrogenovibrio sp.]|uniref:HAD family hydrolase n=1 Tax=Hydrogenovibrio sp. TaxID=2065821 RepID=UPI00286FEF31|nr:HAD-IA family hydrolase [Hydrogenovibrio sp.]MDR9498079.1 HAD-IA family hydrolase [Hydrogenovibrio sp.]
MKQYQCVIFDWDGTLMNSEARIVHAIQVAAERAGFPVLPAEESKQIIGLSLANAVQTLYPQADQAGIDAISHGYTECFLNESDVPMLPFEGLEPLLSGIRQQGAKTVIATGKSRRGLDQVLAETGLGRHFDWTRTPVESASKPDPMMLEQILEKYALSPDEAVMVGDTEFDMQMAHALGMDRIAMSHGVHELERLLAYEPVAHHDDLPSLQAWLKDRLRAHA